MPFFRSERYVDDILEVSRITRGTVQLCKEPVELASILRAAVESIRPLIDAAHLQLSIALTLEPLTVDGDAGRLTQVFENLLNNAAKYTSEGGHIVLTANAVNQHAVVSVRDNGIGISPDMFDRVFEMFTQEERGSGRSQHGLGIGLTLVKGLVELHGGSITVHSPGLENGSDFTVRLPLVASRCQSTVDTPKCEPTQLAHRRVLVVDDNKDAAESLGTLLRLLGAECQVVHNGYDALVAVESFRPMAVLMDIGMPGMDGYEVARRIRQWSDSRAMTLIALTGWGQEKDRRQSESAGFDHHLVKPADVNALETLIFSRSPSP